MFNRERKLSTPEVNAASMADIAFLLLIFFLLVSKLDEEKSISRKLPPLQDKTIAPIIVKPRNVLQLRIGADNRYYAGEEVLGPQQVRQRVEEFVSNAGRNPQWSDNPKEAVIYLDTDSMAAYENYIEIQDEILTAYRNLHDAESRRRYGRSLIQLSKEEREALLEDYPIRLTERAPARIEVQAK